VRNAFGRFDTKIRYWPEILSGIGFFACGSNYLSTDICRMNAPFLKMVAYETLDAITRADKLGKKHLGL
jgi:hypothetical protein